MSQLTTLFPSPAHPEPSLSKLQKCVTLPIECEPRNEESMIEMRPRCMTQPDLKEDPYFQATPRGK